MKNILKTILLVTFILFLSCKNKNNKTPLKPIKSLPKALKEVSGIAYHNNLIYLIEDSGNENEVTVLDTLGNKKNTITINNITNIDWEDLTFDTQGNLYIGDFGNNHNTRRNLAIYKINKSKLKQNEVDVDYKVTFDYPEQKDFPPKKKDLMFDVEAFFEYNEHFYLFTKNRSKNFSGISYVYKVPNKEGQHHAQLINKITTCNDYHNCAITSAAISPNGLKYVLLSHSKVWLYQNYSQDNIFNGTMKEINLQHYSQKEAVCFKNNEVLIIADEKEQKTSGNLFQLSISSSKDK